MASLYSKYFKLWQKLNSYKGNNKGVSVKTTPLILPSNAQMVTPQLIQQMERDIKAVQTKIATKTRLDIRQKREENAINQSFKGVLMGNMPDFNVVKNITADVKRRQAEYNDIRRRYNRSRAYYRNKHGVELEALPKLDKNVVPTRRQIETIKRNIAEQKRLVRKNVREDVIMMYNIEQMVLEAMTGDRWAAYKAEQVQELIVTPYLNDPKQFAKKVAKAKQRIDSVVERFIYDAYQTTPDAPHSKANTMTTEAWDYLTYIFHTL